MFLLYKGKRKASLFFADYLLSNIRFYNSVMLYFSIQSIDLSDDFRVNSNADIVTLPGFFKNLGYATYGSGKIFHKDSREDSYNLSWDGFNRPSDPFLEAFKSKGKICKDVAPA